MDDKTMTNISAIIASELNVKEEYVTNVITLLDEGNTIPFIARYRKEVHGSMDDTSLRTLHERLTYLRNLEERKEAILSSIESQGKLTDELKDKINEAKTLAVLEDLYRPYKQKKRTRATIAKEKGLEPLATFMLLQTQGNPYDEAAKFIDSEKGVETVEDAINGAKDIIAEYVSDDADNRKVLRELLWKEAVLVSKNAKDEDSVYALYYEFSKPIKALNGHQILAINRGEKEDFLKVSVETDSVKAKELLVSRLVKRQSPSDVLLKEAVEDSYDRLIFHPLKEK